MKTIKQIADELKIDKQRVYRYIRKCRISEAHHDAGVMWYDDVAETAILKHFNDISELGEAHHEVHQATSSDTVVDAVITMLRTELEVKNNQIESLNEQLRDVTAALLVAQQTAATAQALHAGTMQKHLTDGKMDSEVAKGFFSRLFNKRNK
jgi:3'-phosphoadenosine 5'-phosphosulfate sulfotransferase